MRDAITAAILLGAAIAAPAEAGRYDRLFQPFDAAPLQPVEARVVQTALALRGHYAGPLDGAWGPASQAAIEAYAWAEHGEAALAMHATPLAMDFVAELEAGDWEFRAFPELGLSFAFPHALMEAPEDEDGLTRWWSADGTLTILAGPMDPAEAADWHETGLATAAGAPLPAERRDARLVTDGRLPDGRRFHSRSDRIGAGFSTVLVVAEPEAESRLNLVAASIQPGGPADWTLPEPSWLLATIALTAEAMEVSTGAAGPLPDAEPGGIADAFRRRAGATARPAAPAIPAGLPAGEWQATGTGFFVNPTSVVTAWHVVESCARVTLADGSALDLAASDPERDLAVLTTATPSPSWLALDAARAPLLGQPVQALGYPYYAITGTVLNLTAGNVSALAGLDDDRRFIAISAPIQPGNSGGPVLGRDGAVMGVAVARLSERYIADATGSTPQNLNYAVTGAELAALLDAHRIGHAGAPRADISAGMPAATGAAVQPVICW